MPSGYLLREKTQNLSLQCTLLPRNKSPSVGTAAFFVTDEKAEPFAGNEVMSDGMCML